MADIPRRSSESAMLHPAVEEGGAMRPRSKTAPNTPKASTNVGPPEAPTLPPGGPMDAYER